MKSALNSCKTLKFSSRGSAPHPAGVSTPDPAKRLNQHEHLPLTLTLAISAKHETRERYLGPRRTLTQTHSPRSHCHPTALPNMRRARIRTCVKSKCEGYGSYLLVLACGMWDWAFGLYLRLAAEVEDFCNPAREHKTPGEHALMIMTVA